MNQEAIQLIQRNRQVRMAEGYLELAMVFDGKFEPDVQLRSHLVRKTIDSLNQASESNCELGKLVYLTGCALKVEGHYQQAIESLLESVEYDPTLVDAYLALGWCYKRVGQVESSVRSMELGLKQSPSHSLLHYNLACYYALQTDLDASTAHLARALQLDPSLRSSVPKEADFDAICDTTAFSDVLRLARIQ